MCLLLHRIYYVFIDLLLIIMCYFEFHPRQFYIRDSHSGKILLQGRSKEGHYQLAHLHVAADKEAFPGERASIMQ